MKTNRLTRLLPRLPLILLLVTALWLYHETDDLFISLRYARNLADGLGAVYNVGERVEGYTTPLWVFVLAGLAYVGVPLQAAATTLSLLSGMLAVWLLTKVAEAWQWKGGTLAAYLLALNTTFAVWSASAMELTLFSAFTLAALWALSMRRWFVSGWLLGLATLTRPEGALWIGVCALYWLISQRFQRRAFAEAVRLTLGAALVVVPHELWRVMYYGEWLPITFYNKVGWSFALWERGAQYMFEAGRAYGLSLVLWVVCALFSREAWRGWSLLALMLIVTHGAYVVFVGGDWMVAYRFLVPIMPLLCLFVAHWMAHVAERLRPAPARVWLGTWVLLGAGTLVGMKLDLQDDLFFTQPLVPDGRLIASSINQHCAPHVSLAAFGIGSLGYHAPTHSIVDMFGLVTPAVARAANDDLGRGMPGHERFNAAAVRALHPAVYVFHTTLDDAPIVNEKGWREGGLAHLIRQFTDDRGFWSEHITRAVELAPKRYFNFVMRIGAPCDW
jgi:hypothetical protein